MKPEVAQRAPVAKAMRSVETCLCQRRKQAMHYTFGIQRGH